MVRKSFTNIFNYKKDYQIMFPDISAAVSLLKPHTNSMKKSFMSDEGCIWDSLHVEIREWKSLSSFEDKTFLMLLDRDR